MAVQKTGIAGYQRSCQGAGETPADSDKLCAERQFVLVHRKIFLKTVDFLNEKPYNIIVKYWKRGDLYERCKARIYP